MPRPGPRPYECVRRAWHSDRLQPMRGSIIQQIFRVVHENHTPATKKNKEWQEKLPIVVFRAEEIMYSKANSEVEYMNLETLWDRLNDAVNTIIRRDESSESGELLPPCVEAALNLGCVPVRASRSQRHSNPRTYLTPRGQEPTSTLATTLNKATDERRLPVSPLHPGNQLNFARAKTMNSSFFGSERSSQIKQHNNPAIPSSPAFLIENVPVVHNNFSMTETNTPLNMGSVYPLYYGIRCQTEEPNLSSQISADANQQTIFLGRPIISSAEPAEHSLRSCKSGNAMSRFPSEVITAREEKLPDTECDLSLRLGVPSLPCVSSRKTWALETGDVAPSSSRERRQFHDQTIYANEEFSFFPTRTEFERFGSCSNMWSCGGQNSESSTKKRKEPFCSNEENEPFCLPPEVPSYWFDSQTKGSGLVAFSWN
ncbi:hypothetical protein IC582_011840 [Cucumis melo]|uniref:Uncharacterized protein LOC103496707 isoform X2 n=1 Tax=Cucumis melo TaxID=3656 RepID=A0A1S3C5I4_CUCME|nr:uncharacterized protein LOC103496707 isoform X2 [Cucumis melo]